MVSVLRGLGVHVALDNLPGHSTPEIAKWLAHKNRRRDRRLLVPAKIDGRNHLWDNANGLAPIDGPTRDPD